MRKAPIIFMPWLAVSLNAQPVSIPDQYWLLLKGDGLTWCAYSNEAEFQADAKELKPSESARITYSAGEMVEVTHQVEAESGDWIVIDKYTLSDVAISVRRSNLLINNFQVIQEAVIREGRVGTFEIVDVSTLDGKKTEQTNFDLPEVPVEVNLSATPYMQVVSKMRFRSLGKLCDIGSLEQRK